MQQLIEDYVLINPTIENVIRTEVWGNTEKVPFLKLCLETFTHENQSLIWYCEHRP